MPRKHLAGAVIVAVVAALAVVFFPRRPAREPLPVFGDVPAFEMRDQEGRPFASDTTLKGHPWVASFIFTRCTTVCPLLTRKVREVQQGTKDLRLVSFTVDPDFDEPPVLAAYARAHDADTRRWWFLQGDAAPVAKAMKMGFDKAPERPVGESIVHGSHLVLVDEAMHIRGFYDSSDPVALRRLIADSTSL